jgi:hypothetical protein
VLGTAWHSAQLLPLNTGPKPSSMVSCGTELGQSVVEIRQLRRGQTRQWIGQIPSRFRVGTLRQQQEENSCCRDKY